MATNSVQDIMLESIGKAARAAEQITVTIDRAKVFTEIAKACAMAIQTKTIADTISAEVPKAKRTVKKTFVEEEKTEQTKETVKEEAQKSIELQPEPVSQAFPQEVISASEAKEQEKVQAQQKTPEQLEEEEYDFTDEWTPKACEILHEEVAEVQRYAEMFSNDIASFNEMITAATQGVSTDIQTITPLNIRVVLQYIQNLEKESNEGE